ncbi:hypothetical protein ACFL42_04865, partial [Candidatus Omnitrophota bacterium]
RTELPVEGIDKGKTQEEIEDDLKKLVLTSLVSPCPVNRIVAMRDIWLRGDTAIPRLVAFLEDREKNIRTGAANVLSRIFEHSPFIFEGLDTPGITRALLRALEKEKDDGAKSAMRHAIEVIGSGYHDTTGKSVSEAKTREPPGRVRRSPSGSRNDFEQQLMLIKARLIEIEGELDDLYDVAYYAHPYAGDGDKAVNVPFIKINALTKERDKLEASARRIERRIEILNRQRLRDRERRREHRRRSPSGKKTYSLTSLRADQPQSSAEVLLRLNEAIADKKPTQREKYYVAALKELEVLRGRGANRFIDEQMEAVRYMALQNAAEVILTVGMSPYLYHRLNMLLWNVHAEGVDPALEVDRERTSKLYREETRYKTLIIVFESDESRKLHLVPLRVSQRPAGETPYVYTDEGNITYYGAELKYDIPHARVAMVAQRYDGYYFPNLSPDAGDKAIMYQEVRLNPINQKRCPGGCLFCERLSSFMPTEDELGGFYKIDPAELVARIAEVHPNSFEYLRHVNLITNSMGSEENVVTYLQWLSRLFSERGFDGQFSYVGHEVRSPEGMQAMRDIGVEDFEFTLEMFTRRSELMSRHKGIPFERVMRILRTARGAGFRELCLNYIEGIDTLEAFEAGITSLTEEGLIDRIDSNVAVAFASHQERLLLPEHRDIEYHLRMHQRYQELGIDYQHPSQYEKGAMFAFQDLHPVGDPGELTPPRVWETVHLDGPVGIRRRRSPSGGRTRKLLGEALEHRFMLSGWGDVDDLGYLDGAGQPGIQAAMYGEFLQAQNAAAQAGLTIILHDNGNVRLEIYPDGNIYEYDEVNYDQHDPNNPWDNKGRLIKHTLPDGSYYESTEFVEFIGYDGTLVKRDTVLRQVYYHIGPDGSPVKAGEVEHVYQRFGDVISFNYLGKNIYDAEGNLAESYVVTRHFYYDDSEANASEGDARVMKKLDSDGKPIATFEIVSYHAKRSGAEKLPYDVIERTPGGEFVGRYHQSYYPGLPDIEKQEIYDETGKERLGERRFDRNGDPIEEEPDDELDLGALAAYLAASGRIDIPEPYSYPNLYDITAPELLSHYGGAGSSGSSFSLGEHAISFSYEPTDMIDRDVRDVGARVVVSDEYGQIEQIPLFVIILLFGYAEPVG